MGCALALVHADTVSFCSQASPSSCTYLNTAIVKMALFLLLFFGDLILFKPQEVEYFNADVFHCLVMWGCEYFKGEILCSSDSGVVLFKF